jgi:NADPH:quinone reductase-like Zn-dependent oxidoreductase
LSLVGAVAGGNVSFDAWRLLRGGALAPPSRTVMTLAEAAAAHALLERHGVSGRVLLVP